MSFYRESLELNYGALQGNKMGDLGYFSIKIETTLCDLKYNRSLTFIKNAGHGLSYIAYGLDFEPPLDDDNSEPISNLMQATSHLPDGTYRIREAILQDGTVWPVVMKDGE
jgi:hypothetical protein